MENLISEIEIHYSHKVKPSQMLQIKTSDDSFRHLQSIWPNVDYRETFMVLHLSRSNRVLGNTIVSTGGISGTVIDCKIIFQSALKANSCAIVLAHNHPSGQKFPSQNDTAITRKIKDAGSLLDIQMLDHIILTSEGYYSFADEGML